jgi:hypothetical protein
MRKIALASAILGMALVSALYTAPAHAQATRTWVSGAGNDANPCSRTSPCETFAGAYAKTSAGGEIDALDPGGFGTLTIGKSITIDGGGGTVASALTNSGNAITVAAGANDVVIIKNVRFQGLLGGNPSCPSGCGLIGLNYTSGGQVVCDTCAFVGFGSNAINVQVSANGFLQVLNSTFLNNQGAIFATGSGGAGAVVQVVGSHFVGRVASGSPAEVGVTAGSGSIVTVGTSSFQDLVYGVFAESGGTLSVDSSLFSSVLDCILTTSGTTTSASNNSFYGGTAFAGSGTVNTPNNNKIGGGATVGTATVNSAGMTVD